MNEENEGKSAVGGYAPDTANASNGGVSPSPNTEEAKSGYTPSAPDDELVKSGYEPDAAGMGQASAGGAIPQANPTAIPTPGEAAPPNEAAVPSDATPQSGGTPPSEVAPPSEATPSNEATPSGEAAPPSETASPGEAGAPNGETGVDGQQTRRKKSAASVAVAAFLCAVSVAAFLCTGAFVAEAIRQAGSAFFYTGFAAPKAAVPEIKSPPGSETAETDVAERAGEAETEQSAKVDNFPVAHVSMAAADPFEISNMTDYEPDVEELTSAEAFAASATAVSDGPTVLVVHTHATEAYIADGETEYNENTSFRSENTDENVVAVGSEICEELERAGIKTLHCTRLFDAEDFNRAYELSAAAVGEYLEKYPSLSLVLDVHRDAVFYPDSTLVAPTTDDCAAQVMIVCGTDEQGANFPDWRDNLSFAFSVQAAARSLYPDLMRGVNLRGASFNEQLAKRYLLVEVGSAGNTLGEAKTGARRFAEALAKVIGG